MTILVVTGTGTGVGKTVVCAALASAARQAGIDVAVCKPVQTGTARGDDDLAEVGRLAGVTQLAGLARYPQPMAPAAAAEHAGMALPARDQIVRLIADLDRPGRLTLVEGAGGLLVELAEPGVTLRDVAVDVAAAALVVVTADLGTLNHTKLTLEALAAQQVSCAGLVIGSWPDRPGWWQPRIGPRWRALLRCGRSARRGRVAGCRGLRGDERGGVRPQLGCRAGRLMVHSIELVFDSDTEAAIRRIWAGLAAAGIPSQAPASRPHVSLAVAERIAPEVDEPLGAVARRLPLDCVIGAPVLFGRANVVFTRLVVPTSELLALHAEVHRLCGPHLAPAPMANSLPGQWTAHVTLARRVGGHQLGRALRIAGRPSRIDGRFAGLRRWDGNTRAEYLLG